MPRSCIRWLLLGLTLLFGPSAVLGAVPARQDSIFAADAAFQAGHFVAAQAAYTRLLQRNPNAYGALLGLGTLALYANRLAEARTQLERARSVRPNDVEPRVLLAEAAMRRDAFSVAESLVSAINFGGSPLQQRYSGSVSARQLASFRDRKPYVVDGPGDVATIPFVKTDPLPLVHARVNGAPETTFLIDTGGAQVVLDPNYARELRVPQYGAMTGLFAGGKRIGVPYGRIDALTLGAWHIRNVPIQLVSVRPIAAAVGVKRVDGVIGSVLLYHFLSTMDYAKGRLILRRIGGPAARAFTKASSAARTVPFLLVGDHFEFAEGHVNALPPAQFDVDTGLGGAGVNLSDELLAAAKIRLNKKQATVGVGGAGDTQTIPYTVPTVWLGGVRRTGVAGFYDGGISPLKQQLGFTVGSVIGHDFFRPFALTFDFQRMLLVIR
jgi:predicted aspartyl protease